MPITRRLPLLAALIGSLLFLLPARAQGPEESIKPIPLTDPPQVSRSEPSPADPAKAEKPEETPADEAEPMDDEAEPQPEQEPPATADSRKSEPPAASDSRNAEPLVAGDSRNAEPPAAGDSRNAAPAASAPAEPPASRPPTPAAASAPLTPELQALRQKLRQTLAYYYNRPVSTVERSPWATMHWVIGFGVDAQFNTGEELVNGLAWMCANRPCYGMRMLYTDEHGIAVRIGPGYQGHEGQLLSVLALSRVKADYPLYVDGQTLSIAALVKREQWSCQPRTELTFKLIGLAHYLDSDAKWVSSDGQSWDIPRLIKEEIAQPVVGSACGGTHRMIGLAYAVNRRVKAGRPVEGQWLRAQKYVQAYQEHTFKLQNADGSFSTGWFEKPGHSGDLNRFLNTTGHGLEWMTFSLPKDQLTDPRMVQAVTFLVNLLWDNRKFDWEIGPQGHALRALSLYDEYVFGGKPGQRAVQLAEADRAARIR